DVLQAAEKLHRRLAECSRQLTQVLAVLQQQQKDVGNLKQVIIGLPVFRVGGVQVLQLETTVLLAVEALVFNVPAVTSSLGGDVDHGCFGYRQVREPDKRLRLPVHGFLTL